MNNNTEIVKVWYGRKKPFDVVLERIYHDEKRDPKHSFTMRSAYTKNKDYIGNTGIAHRLWRKYGIEHFERRKDDSTICSVGYSPRDNKWYGWSHRAIYGFSIGSEVKKGSCAYVPPTFEELNSDCHLRQEDLSTGKKGLCTANCSVEYEDVLDSQGKLTDELKPVPGTEILPVPCKPENCVLSVGRGEWTAKTMDDAKQMAKDFAESVS